MQLGSLFRSITKAIKWPGQQEAEESLMIKRANGHGATILIPLSDLWIFAEDKEEAVGKIQRFCDAMYGEGNWSGGEFMHLARYIESRLDDLLQTAPEKEMTKNEFENALDKMNVRITNDGETLIDTMDSNKPQIFLGRQTRH